MFDRRMDETAAAGLLSHPPARGVFDGSINSNSDAEDGRSANILTPGSGDTRPVAIAEGEQRLVSDNIILRYL